MKDYSRLIRARPAYIAHGKHGDTQQPARLDIAAESDDAEVTSFEDQESFDHWLAEVRRGAREMGWGLEPKYPHLRCPLPKVFMSNG